MDYPVKIFTNYHEKNFAECVDLIDSAPENTRLQITYNTMKAACLLNLKLRIDEVHSILDKVLIIETKNAFAHYGKGFAFFEQQKFNEAIIYFNNAIDHSRPRSMRKAREMKEKSENMLKELKKSDEHKENLTAELTQTSIKVEKDKTEEQKSVKKTPDGKINKCSQCDGTFVSNSSLNRHMKLHTSEKLYKCYKCGYAFYQKSNLKRHMKTHKKPNKNQELPSRLHRANKAKKHFSDHRARLLKVKKAKTHLNHHRR